MAASDVEPEPEEDELRICLDCNEEMEYCECSAPPVRMPKRKRRR